MSEPAPSPSAMTKEQSRKDTLRVGAFVLAGLNMASWLMYATSSWSTDGQPITLYMALQFIQLIIVQPLVSIPALWLAWKNQQITKAFWLAATPWILYLISVIAFGISVAIYGF